MGRWLWLLTNQLYRPSCKSVTPALCFGFAVNGGGCLTKNLITRFRGIPKKCHTRQTAASIEGLIVDAGDAVTNRDARQAGASIEGALPDTGNTIRNRDARQVGAPLEGSSPDTGDTIRDRDARQTGALVKSANPDAGDRFALDSNRYN